MNIIIVKELNDMFIYYLDKLIIYLIHNFYLNRKKNIYMILVYFSFLFCFIHNTLILPFKNNRFQKNNLSLKEIVSNEIFTEIKLGNPEQKIKLQLTFLSHYIFITKDYYHINKSSTYSKLEVKEKKYSSKEMDIKGYLSTEKLNIQNNILSNFSFIYIENTTINNYNRTLKNCLLGLRPKPYYYQVNLLQQLKQNNLTESYIYSIKYNNENEGEIIIGKYPHEYNINYKEEKLKIISAEIFASKFDWSTQFKNITYGNITKEYTLNGEFSLDYSGIIGTKQYKEEIDKLFFNQLFNNGSCSYDQIPFGNDNFVHLFIYICNKDINIINFTSLNFFHYDLNMSFTFGRDLFKEFNGKKYFMVFLPEYNINRWILGEIFLKKYLIVLEQNKGIMGFYYDIETKINFPYSYVFIAILLILVFILSFLLYRALKKKRKLRANELDDDFEYLPSPN